MFGPLDWVGGFYLAVWHTFFAIFEGKKQKKSSRQNWSDKRPKPLISECVNSPQFFFFWLRLLRGIGDRLIHCHRLMQPPTGAKVGERVMAEGAVFQR